MRSIRIVPIILGSAPALMNVKKAKDVRSVYREFFFSVSCLSLLRIWTPINM